MLNVRRRLGSRGDTIVEVLIVLAIIGLSLGIAYATADHSLGDNRRAQERTEALDLLQSQIEGLRSLSTGTNIYLSGYFCVYNLTSPTLQTTGFSGSPPTGYPSQCQQGTSSRYKLADSYSGPVDGSGTFTLTAMWDDVLGSGQDQASLVYRMQ